MVVRDDDTLTEDAIRVFLLDHVAPSKVPRRIFFTDAIPKTPNGKPLRSAGTRQYS
jgi:acyl-CoA synthetase (AMP-forming)/AMP-acid ligase II